MLSIRNLLAIAAAALAPCMPTAPAYAAGDAVRAQSVAAPGAAQRGPFGNEAAAASSVLAAQRGGNGTSSAAQLKGAVSGNQATHVTTGANALGSGAFAGAGGVSTVIQNTGNNVLIQNSTIVNVQLK